MNQSFKQLHLIIFGQVQGVGYRGWILDYVRNKPISGWVKNTSGGAVEIVAQSSEKVLKQFIDDCWIGPPAAKVSQIKVKWSIVCRRYGLF